MEFTAKQIAELIGGRTEGDESAIVSTFAKIEEGVPGAISFLSNPKYTHYIYETKSSVVLINEDVELEHPVSATLIRVKDAYESVAKLLQLYESMKPRKSGIHPTACISENPYAVVGDGAQIGDGTQIYPHTVIGEGVTIGQKCLLYPNVTIYQGCRIGNNVTIHAGSVIGADGFGFAPNQEGYDKIPQIGIVVIEDNVEIGANTCVDRSTMGQTVIHKGVKLDNLIQVAHNCEIGENTVMSAQAGLAGSTKIGSWCMVGGQAGRRRTVRRHQEYQGRRRVAHRLTSHGSEDVLQGQGHLLEAARHVPPDSPAAARDRRAEGPIENRKLTNRK